MSRMAPITNELTMLYSIVDDLTNLQGSALPLQYQRIDALIEKYELKVKAAQQTSWEDARNAFHTLD